MATTNPRPAWKEPAKGNNHDILDAFELRRRIHAWFLQARTADWPRSALRPLVAIELGDKEFNKSALPEEKEFEEICDSLVKLDREDHSLELPPPVQRCKKSAELESAAWILAGACLTFLLFDQDTKNSMPDIYLYAASSWPRHSKDFWQMHAHDFHGTHCHYYIDEAKLLDLTLRFLADEEKRDKSLQALVESRLSSWRGIFRYESLENLTPLHFAADFDLDKVASILLKDPNVDINARTGTGETPLEAAVWGKDKRVLSLLLSKPGVQDNMYRVPFISRDQEEFVRKHARNPLLHPSLTPLHLAAMLNLNDAIASLLQEPGTDVNVQDSLGRPPLFYAAGRDVCRNWALPSLLAAPGVDVELATNRDGSPLRKKIEIYLANLGIETPIVPKGLTPLHLAAIFDEKESAGMLL